MSVLDGFKPERVMYYFEELTKIPRCSREEQRISDYLVGVGKQLGLEVIQDEALNVIIKKPGTEGYENSPTVVLQGHMDMVCEKNDNSNHDFSKDSINIRVDGDLIVADETTLGADNGVAVAIGLALMEENDISHPPLELLITSDEETGMTGANQLDTKNINGKILINIDSEEEGKILVSCAGGERNLVTIPLKWIDLKEPLNEYKLEVSGLKGGHSGMEIDKGRGNSNKILGRILEVLEREVGINMKYVEGGSKSNAIPRYSMAKICFSSDKLDRVNNIIETQEKMLKRELSSSDGDIKIVLKAEDEQSNKIFDKDTKKTLINCLFLIPNGVQSMSMDIKGLVESSNNLGVVKTLEYEIIMESSIRSSIGSLKEDIRNRIKVIAEILGAKSESTASYPAWEYKKDSYIRDVFKKAYRDINGKEIEIEAIHAGLECGLFDEKFDDIDMISFGPNIYGVHAPGENFSISSTERSYQLLLKVLEYTK